MPGCLLTRALPAALRGGHYSKQKEKFSEEFSPFTIGNLMGRNALLNMLLRVERETWKLCPRNKRHPSNYFIVIWFSAREQAERRKRHHPQGMSLKWSWSASIPLKRPR